ncbi:MAG: hypothetical protein E6G97_07410 [Alphaproteobacteria bacterium]|nr:MAG: hypothetical protein E6G97_07410 [Alphaproteobacteria bacterium]
MGANGPSWGRRHIAWRSKHDQALQAQQHADKLACEAWNERMLQLGGPIRPSPSLRAAISGGFPFLRVLCNGCQQSSWVNLANVRRPAETWIWQLEASLVCQPCRERTRFPPRAAIEILCRYDRDQGPGPYGER